VRDYRIIGIEDLNVRGMLANRHLARTITDAGLGEFRRQLEYKAAMRGSVVKVVDRWYPSSKLCSSCGVLSTKVSIGVKFWECSSCGVEHDRDENAALNLRTAASPAVAACGA
jgi:putative transposase